MNVYGIRESILVLSCNRWCGRIQHYPIRILEKWWLRHTRAFQCARILPDQQYDTLNHPCTVCLTFMPGPWGTDRI